MQGKKEKFYAILKKYDVKCYWESESFNPVLNHPFGMIIIPKFNVDMFSEINSLYNDDENMSEELMLAIVMKDLKSVNSNAFKKRVKNMRKVILE